MSGPHHITSKHPQLNICMESTILRLITGLGNAEITGLLQLYFDLPWAHKIN